MLEKADVFKHVEYSTCQLYRLRQDVDLIGQPTLTTCGTKEEEDVLTNKEHETHSF
jgi:hypothetical protein